MHRNHLLSLLNIYIPPTIEEQQYKHRIIQFIENNPSCFERSLAIGHLTASALLLNKDHSKVLLMHHAKLNRWLQPGGHCDGNNNPLEVAIKEVQEETGITTIIPVSMEIFDIDIHLIPARKDEPAHYHYDIRFLLRTPQEEFIKNHESKELRWFSNNKELFPTQGPSVLRMVDKWLNCKL